MTILSNLATIFGVISAVALFPQVFKIFQRRSAKDISILTYILAASATIVWILYGIELQNTPILITNILGGASIALVMIGWFLYGRKK